MATVTSQKTNSISQPLQQSMPLLARLPQLGIILFIFGVLVFAGFALDLKNHGPLLYTDQVLANQLHRDALTEQPAISDAIHISAFWLGREFTEGIALILAIYLLVKKYWRDFWIIALGAAGGGAVWFLLTRLFDRPRPSFPVNLEHLTDPSFPSGHTLNSVIVFGLIAYLLYPYLRSKTAKAILVLAVLAMTLYVGFGRLFAGGHYLTDVLAGYAIGIAWAALVATVVDWWYFRRRASS